jgi:hypothetical protein
MAIKIRCVDCKKKISIDEAFAGGVCRCPYCTAIVYVPDDAGQKKPKKSRAKTPARRPKTPGARPTAPTPAAPPSRPQAPTPARVETPVPADTMADTAIDAPPPVDTLAETAIDAPAAPATPTRPTAPAQAPVPQKTATQAEADKAMALAHGQKNIPIAAPVKFQGIVAIFLLLLLVGMVGGMIYLAIEFTSTTVVDTTPEDYGNTAITTRDFPAVAGTIKVTAPIVYCIDTSKPMANFFEGAEGIVIASAKSLKGGKFNVILLGEDEDKIMSEKPIAADAAGIKKAQAFIEFEQCGMADQARGLNKALEMGAKTVVLLATDNAMGAKEVAQGPLKEKSVKLHAIALGRRSRGLEEMAKATGGTYKKFTTSDLAEHARRAAENK